jgi:hypothetical protein
MGKNNAGSDGELSGNPTLPTDSELESLALQVDDQLNELQSQSFGEVEVRGIIPGKRSRLPAAPKQQAVIEQATGEPFESFWDKFKRHARRDLCLPEGNLYKQWQKWRDLRSKDSVKVALGVIAGMGIPTASIGPVAVAASVFQLNVIANIGVEAICEGCAEEEAERKKALKEAAKEKKQNQKP